MTGKLTQLPSFDSGKCLAVIETPRGSHHKYDYKTALDCFELNKTLPEGMSFPLDFWFIPSTLGADGDPLDVLVILDFPAEMGAMVRTRLIGCIQGRTKVRRRRLGTDRKST